MAILGPSGAGKTSLLNILAQRQTRFQGSILVNGVKPGKKFKSLAAFVQQEDILMGNMTVRETLVFHALLRLPSEKTYKQKMQRVDDLIRELGLEHCQHTKVGISGVFKGISGGEKKRCMCLL